MNGATVSQEAIEKAKAIFPGKAPEITPSNGNGRRLDVGAYLEHYGIPFREKANGSVVIYGLLNGCVLDQGHTSNEAAIIQTADGALLYQCFHDSCKSNPDRIWKAARKIISSNDNLGPFMRGGTSSETHGDTNNAGHATADDVRLSSSEKANLEEVLESSVIEVRQFLKADIPEQPCIIDPILHAGTLLLLYAARGIGKTWLCLILALAITRKMLIGPWTVTKPTGVLYVDGEMASYELQTRLKNLSALLPKPETFLFILSSDWMLKNEHPAPNIVNAEWREAIYNLIKKWRSVFGVMILDNLSSLTPGTSENEQIDWDPINRRLNTSSIG